MSDLEGFCLGLFALNREMQAHLLLLSMSAAAAASQTAAAATNNFTKCQAGAPPFEHWIEFHVGVLPNKISQLVAIS